MTIQQLGLSDAVLDLLGQRLSRKSSKLKARYEVLVNRENVVEVSKPGNVEFETRCIPTTKMVYGNGFIVGMELQVWNER
ncbi:unnamed protein product [Lactuca virosa]|uniref:Histone-lysine N-methyltransferase CLF-like HTH domain-containing protein n=1 Tax=Lactuca virosa TaxID=75947 RepID=A0AAU9PI09_9ASTR|nr:unnamed protein product [Lactuca virosa]